MKRVLTGIAAASMVLGTMAPAAFAATTSSSTNYNQRSISIGSYTAGVKGISATDPWTKKATEFLPIYYLEQGLKAAGYTAKWDGQNLYLTAPKNADLSNISPVVPSPKDTVIYVNDVPVYTAPKPLVAVDPASGTKTSFIPIFYLGEAMKALGYNNTYKNGVFSETPAVKPTLAIKGNNTIAVGNKDTLTLTSTDAQGNTTTVPASDVAWSVSGGGDAFVNGDAFTATASGSYTVTASYQGQSVTASVTVSGAAAKLEVAKPANIVANGESTQTLTIDAQDASGNLASNYNGTATVEISDGSVVTFPSDTTVQNGDFSVTTSTKGTVTFKDGVGKVVVQAGSIPGSTATINVTSGDLTDSNGNAITASNTITTIEQVATSVKVTPEEKFLQANQSGNQGAFDVEVDDQDGQPMLSGAYSVSMNLSGAANFIDGTKGPETVAFVGDNNPGNPSDAVVNVQSISGDLGTVTVVGSASGLTSGSGNMNSVVAGPASQLTVSDSNSEFAQNSSTVLTVAQADANGYPTSETVSPDYSVTVKDSAGNDVTSDFTISGRNSDSITVTPDHNTGSSAVALAGTYYVTVSDNSGTLSSSKAFKIVVDPDTTDTTYFDFVKPQLAVSEANPSTTFQVETVDQYGNPVTSSSTLTLTASLGSGNVTLNGQDGTKGVKVTTNSDGVATVNFSAQPYGGTWVINASKTSLSSLAGHGSESINIRTTVPTELTGSFQNASGSNTSVSQVGNTVTFNVYAKDQYGNPVGSDEVLLTPSSGLALSAGTVGGGASLIKANSDGSEIVQLHKGTATISNVPVNGDGSQSVKMSDLYSVNGLTGSAGISVNAGAFAKYGVFDTSGDGLGTNNSDDVTQFASGTPVAVWVRPTDSKGNPVVSTVGQQVTLTGSNGEFRKTASGAKIGTVFVPAGSNGVMVYFVNNDSTADYTTLTASAETPWNLSMSKSSNTVTAHVYDTDANVSGAKVVFSASDLSPTTVYTNSNGDAVVTYSGSNTVTAQVYGIDGSVATSGTK